jgi:septal ring factor EnvC (AmiA/AmiB activator)
MIDDAQLWEIGKIAGGIAVGVLGAFGGRSWVRNRTSRDALLIAKDRGEIGIIERLQSDNSALRIDIDQVASERNEALSIRGRLEERVAALTAQLSDARASLEEARRRIDAMDAELTSVKAMLQRALSRDG